MEVDDRFFAKVRDILPSSKVVLVAVLFLLFRNANLTGTDPVFLVNPVSITAIDGTTVEFSCTANNTEEISFRVNGSSAGYQDKGFVPLFKETVDGTVQRRNLKVYVSSLYNNTEIFCRGLGKAPHINSDTAVLTVQGPLSSVDDLPHSFFNSSTVNISWSPPFTLPGTAITGYNISVTSNGTTTKYFTSDSYYVLQLNDITDSPCNEINITVSGYNGLNGETDSISVIYPLSGCLFPVDDLSSFINSSTAHISESPPFTLPGTTITGYNLPFTGKGKTSTSGRSVFIGPVKRSDLLIKSTAVTSLNTDTKIDTSTALSTNQSNIPTSQSDQDVLFEYIPYIVSFCVIALVVILIVILAAWKLPMVYRNRRNSSRHSSATRDTSIESEETNLQLQNREPIPPRLRDIVEDITKLASKEEPYPKSKHDSRSSIQELVSQNQQGLHNQPRLREKSEVQVLGSKLGLPRGSIAVPSSQPQPLSATPLNAGKDALYLISKGDTNESERPQTFKD